MGRSEKAPLSVSSPGLCLPHTPLSCPGQSSQTRSLRTNRYPWTGRKPAKWFLQPTPTPHSASRTQWSSLLCPLSLMRITLFGRKDGLPLKVLRKQGPLQKGRSPLQSPNPPPMSPFADSPRTSVALSTLDPSGLLSMDRCFLSFF